MNCIEYHPTLGKFRNGERGRVACNDNIDVLVGQVVSHQSGMKWKLHDDGWEILILYKVHYKELEPGTERPPKRKN